MVVPRYASHFPFLIITIISTSPTYSSKIEPKQAIVTMKQQMMHHRRRHSLEMILISFLMSLNFVGGFKVSSTFFNTINLHKRMETDRNSQRTNICLQYSLTDPAVASVLAKRLYPASMVGTLGEVFFRTRYEMECPRGAVSICIYFDLFSKKNNSSSSVQWYP